MNAKKTMILILSSFVLFGFQPKLDYPVIFLLQEKARGCDVIFTSAYKPYFNFKYPLITPSLKQVKRAEKILIKHYNQANENIFKNTTAKYKPIKNVKKHFKYYKRQYFSYEDKNKDTIIIIQLLNFKRKRWAEKHFKDWDKDFFIEYDYFSNKIIREVYEINLGKNKLTLLLKA